MNSIGQKNNQFIFINEEQRALLMQEIPSDIIKYRKGPDGRQLSYVEHAWVTERLNIAFGWAWSWEIVEWHFVPNEDPLEVFVLGHLTLHTPNGDLIKSQFGSADVRRSKKTGLPLSIGDDLKAASSDALKKASSLLGLALDLYKDKRSERSFHKTDTLINPKQALAYINQQAIEGYNSLPDLLQALRQIYNDDKFNWPAAHQTRAWKDIIRRAIEFANKGGK